MLRDESGIDARYLVSDRYRTIFAGDQDLLGEYGFTDGQIQWSGTGLLVIIHTLDGRLAYQFRPNHPSTPGRKYINPLGRALRLDVPFDMHGWVREQPWRPLWITEGAKKVDSLASRSQAVIGLSGVYGWRGRPSSVGGRVVEGAPTAPLAEWDLVPLKNRAVYLCFDRDVMTKPQVRRALEDLSAFLRTRGAVVVRIVPPEVPDLAKAGVDDFLARGGTVEQLVGSGLDDGDADHRQNVERERERRRVRREVDAEEATEGFTVPEYRRTLTEELAVSDEPLAWQVQELLPVGANAVLAAQFKSGKTTLAANLAAALADGTPLFGTLPVLPTQGRVGFANYEVTDRQMRAWWRDLHISRPDRIAPMNLRGYSIPLLAPVGEDFLVQWAEECRVEYLVVDPWGRAIVGSAEENSNAEVRQVLDVLDRIKRRAGITGLLVVSHTGRAEMEEGREHARGATALDDWADVRLLLTRNQQGQRWLSAEGRDVAFPESPLMFDSATRRLTLGELGHSRGREREHDLIRRVLDAVAENPGIGKRALLQLAGGEASAAQRTVDGLVRDGRLVVQREGRTMHHYVDDSRFLEVSE